MPVYDYRCSSGHEFEAEFPLAEFEATRKISCSCGALAERVILRAPFMRGMTVAGHDAWDGGGLWSGRNGLESPAAAEMQRRIEAGTFSGRSRQEALALVRTHELAVENGLHSEAGRVEEIMRHHAAEADRVASGAPIVGVTRKGKKFTVTQDQPTTTQRDGTTEVSVRTTVAAA